MSYGTLIGDRSFHKTIDSAVRLKSAAAYRVIGQPVPRVELPGKITGIHRYVHNVRVPGMRARTRDSSDSNRRDARVSQ